MAKGFALLQQSPLRPLCIFIFNIDFKFFHPHLSTALSQLFMSIYVQDFKKEVNAWNKRRSQLENTLEKKKENNRPAAEVERTQQILNEHMITQPSQNWMLTARDSIRNIIRDPMNFVAGAFYILTDVHNYSGAPLERTHYKGMPACKACNLLSHGRFCSYSCFGNKQASI